MPMTLDFRQPMPQERIMDAREVGRYEVCPLAWWYDRQHPLASADVATIMHRMELLTAVYGPGTQDLPEYQLLQHLRERAEARVTPGVAVPVAQPIRPAGAPHSLLHLVIAIAAIVIGLVAAGMVFAVTQGR